MLTLIFVLKFNGILMMTLEEDYDNDITTSDEVNNDVNTSITQNEVKVNTGTRHAFFRDMDVDPIVGGSGSRRVFGGSAMDLKNFNVVCALLDRYWVVRCTATIIAPHWVLTAAHCVTSRLAYVKYNTRRPASTDGNITAVHVLYQHPQYVYFIIFMVIVLLNSIRIVYMRVYDTDIVRIVRTY